MTIHQHDLRKLESKIIQWISQAAILFFLFFMFWILYDIFSQGLESINLNFLKLSPKFSGREGGIFPILVSTFYIILMALSISLPISLFTAIFIHEWTKTLPKLSAYLQKILDILASVPSIVFGLFGNAFFVEIMGFGFSILSGALTLSCMILPTIIRSIQIGLQSINNDIEINAVSMGLTKKSIMLKILLPLAFPSIVLGTILGTARALAETAALLFTSGYVDKMPESIMDSGRALSIHIYELAMNVPGGNTNAYASALVLIILLFIINSLSLTLSHLWQKRISSE